MSDFAMMRADLVRRGLLDADFKLTDAGRDYADQLLLDLRDVEARQDPAGARVVWNTSRGRMAA